MMAKRNQHWKPDTRQIVRVVAWLQIIASAIIVGILLHSLFLIQTKGEQSSLHHLLASYYSPLLDSNTYGAEKFALAGFAFTSFAGLLTGFVLLDGASRRRTLNLKLWLVYALVFANVDLAVHNCIVWPSIALFCRIIVAIAFYCLGAWEVVSLLQELSRPACGPLVLTFVPTTPSRGMKKGQLDSALPSPLFQIRSPGADRVAQPFNLPLN